MSVNINQKTSIDSIHPVAVREGSTEQAETDSSSCMVLNTLKLSHPTHTTSQKVNDCVNVNAPLTLAHLQSDREKQEFSLKRQAEIGNDELRTLSSSLFIKGKEALVNPSTGQNKFKAAVPVLLKAFDLNPDNEDAITMMEEIQELGKTDHEAALALGLAFLSLGNKEASLHFFEKASEMGNLEADQEIKKLTSPTPEVTQEENSATIFEDEVRKQEQASQISVDLGQMDSPSERRSHRKQISMSISETNESNFYLQTEDGDNKLIRTVNTPSKYKKYSFSLTMQQKADLNKALSHKRGDEYKHILMDIDSDEREFYEDMYADTFVESQDEGNKIESNTYYDLALFLLEHGGIKGKNNKYLDAIDYLQDAITTWPDNKAAKEKLNEIQKEAKKSREIAFALGSSCMKLGELAKAREWMELAKKLGDPQASIRLKELSLLEKKEKQALSAYAAGAVCLKMNKKMEARKWFEKAASDGHLDAQIELDKLGSSSKIDPQTYPKNKISQEKRALKSLLENGAENSKLSEGEILKGVFASNILKKSFRKFVEGEYSEENFDFYFAIEDYKLQTGEARILKALSIRNEYFSKRYLNVSSEVLAEAKNSDGGLFLAQEEVYNLMKNDTLSRFIKAVMQ